MINLICSTKYFPNQPITHIFSAFQLFIFLSNLCGWWLISVGIKYDITMKIWEFCPSSHLQSFELGNVKTEPIYQQLLQQQSLKEPKIESDSFCVSDDIKLRQIQLEMKFYCSSLSLALFCKLTHITRMSIHMNSIVMTQLPNLYVYSLYLCNHQ